MNFKEFYLAPGEIRTVSIDTDTEEFVEISSSVRFRTTLFRHNEVIRVGHGNCSVDIIHLRRPNSGFFELAHIGEVTVKNLSAESASFYVRQV